ncbi:hypothetical protein C2U72_11350 [Prosthecomicrobium hirschii]|uniref:hypothetical protein n=1 Tax=Prosthecodimorpha hirschii TaxID=665126 RepID=UPI0015E2B7EC|nr:hypothetical protein [Prosthecomicrobium hirschii]TPQ50845.1 hypothetical protein C2U72_11350 [Prosthecomicrobium hirschii]
MTEVFGKSTAGPGHAFAMKKAGPGLGGTARDGTDDFRQLDQDSGHDSGVPRHCAGRPAGRSKSKSSDRFGLPHHPKPEMIPFGHDATASQPRPAGARPAGLR